MKLDDQFKAAIHLAMEDKYGIIEVREGYNGYRGAIMLGRPKAGVTSEDRFWSKVVKNECWLWLGSLAGGYGQLQVNGKSVRAHRFSWELHNGLIPEGLWVLHKCDVCNCVNPAHLYLGTRVENIRDAMERNRLPTGLSREPCINGHEFNDDNFSVKRATKRGKAYLYRICLVCSREQNRRRYSDRKDQYNAARRRKRNGTE